jgi:hypothetical protein
MFRLLSKFGGGPLLVRWLTARIRGYDGLAELAGRAVTRWHLLSALTREYDRSASSVPTCGRAEATAELAAVMGVNQADSRGKPR